MTGHVVCVINVLYIHRAHAIPMNTRLCSLFLHLTLHVSTTAVSVVFGYTASRGYLLVIDIYDCLSNSAIIYLAVRDSSRSRWKYQ
ncbi:uncharacterized protein HD556DRAFT_1411258 [Suillus plorans]|uniref:Uncharacterized protein n=1 Tax=Suillus plorans TaxID=116603 RepID=A0A9P7ADA8_9AGAM|nr:uncharacterized protein HD556DRAFT_1411258 [Suillus plorans]KAG1787094.1 hypothetical protein HD556DRAFT_1411258 [Suillus plorans]